MPPSDAELNSVTCRNFHTTSNSQMPARYLTIQLRHLLGDSVRLHRLRTQSHKTVLHFRGQSQVEVVTCPTGSKSEVPLTPSLGLINLPEWLFQLNKHVFSLDYQFITKDIKRHKATARWRNTWGKFSNKGASIPLKFGAQHEWIWKHSDSPAWKKPTLWSFIFKASLHRYESWNHWPLETD